jgi:hypothetical protein
MKLRKEMKEKEEEEGNAKKEGTITFFSYFFNFIPISFFLF